MSAFELILCGRCMLHVFRVLATSLKGVSAETSSERKIPDEGDHLDCTKSGGIAKRLLRLLEEPDAQGEATTAKGDKAGERNGSG